MNDHGTPHQSLAYARGQWVRARTTALGHDDDATRERAEERAAKWLSVLNGIFSGRIAVGSRTPVELPAWVTLEVLQGGFATGAALAAGELRPYEKALADRAGVPHNRLAIFDYHLTEAGLAELRAQLESGAYRIGLPEEAALLVVAWLLHAGDTDGACDLVETIERYAGLRFTAEPSAVPQPGPEVVWREPVGRVRRALEQRAPQPRVAAMREALTVWNPFADELLDLWLETVEQGRVAVRADGPWRARGALLLERYETLAATHTHCRKHRRPKENLAVLRTALAEVVAGRELTPRSRGLLQHAVDSMLRRRGRPGSPSHAALRSAQARNASAPAHHEVARVVAARLAHLDPAGGIEDLTPVLAPVAAAESHQGLPVGTPVPPPVARVARRAWAASVEELVVAGLVPSAEVLAQLIPQIAAATVAAPYPDDLLRTLMAANYRAFRQRRSLLLQNLEHQVRLDELPWVRAVARYRSADDGDRDAALRVLRRFGALTIDAFPATLLPNPVVRELEALSREAGLRLPWVEELAADIFEGRFSVKFIRAAALAGELLDGTVYARYYGTDYALLAEWGDLAGAAEATGRRADRAMRYFATWCRERAGLSGRPWSVAANGMIIEQAQILTTHNLATLVHGAGVRPDAGWRAAARETFRTTIRLAARVPAAPRPLPVVKEIAYAWRHLVFHLSMPEVDPVQVVGELHGDLESGPPAARRLLLPVLRGLEHVAEGGVVDASGAAGAGRRLLGWSVGPHWLLTPPQDGAVRG